MWICMPTMMRPQSCKSSTKYTTTCVHSAEVETPPASRQNYSYPGFLRRNLRELQPSATPTHCLSPVEIESSTVQGSNNQRQGLRSSCKSCCTGVRAYREQWEFDSGSPVT